MGLAGLSVALIPLGVLFSAARDRSLRRRPRFRLRLAGFMISVSLPDVVVAVGTVFGMIHSASVAPLLLSLFWGLLVLVLAPVFLFYGHDPEPGPNDDGEDGPDPGHDPPSPTPPIGDLPLPDAEQSRLRFRGPRPAPGSTWKRRREHQPTRTPSRVPF